MKKNASNILDFDQEKFFELSLDLFAIANTDGFFLKLNSSWKKTLGWDNHELLAEPFLNFVHPDDIEATLNEIENQRNGGIVQQFTNRYRCKDGSYRWLEWVSSPISDGLIYAIARDKTDQKRIELDRDRFFNISIDLMVIANTDGTFRKVNERWREILGWEQHELENQPFFDFVHPDDIEPTLVELEKEKKGERVTNFVNRYRCKNGTYKYLEWFTQPEPDGTIYAVARDITERKTAEEKVRKLAMTDPLTRLANRTHFDQRLSQSMKLAKREGKSLALMMIDLDRFKLVNDSFGHPVGDAVLKRVAKSFTKLTRETDIVARLGGDEFAILIVHPEKEESALLNAQRLIDEVNKNAVIMGNEIKIGISIGIALFPKDANNPKELLKKADIALYDAKARGRGVFSLFEEDMYSSGNEG